MFKIGNVEIKGNLVLAPMAGVSNFPFRESAKRCGASLVYGEMISDKGIHYNNEKTKDLLYISPNEKPIALQIFGSDINTLLEAAIYLDRNTDCDIIDINMGCPVPKVAIKNQAGAAILKNPNKIYEIVRTIVDNVSKPVTVKIRSGWDEVNAVENAREIERAGASAITIHGRTRKQGYSGEVNLDIIREVKKSVSIPVIGNGDIIDGISAKKMFEYTGVDAIMIGRASLGNPWIFREIEEYLKNGKILKKPTNTQIYQQIMKHMKELMVHKGEKIACLEMRSHGAWYLKGLPGVSIVRSKVSRISTYLEFESIINEFFESLQ